jgi:hypothetical protein
VRYGSAAALSALALLAGCGSADDGPEAPEIGKAKSFELVGLTPREPVRVGKPTTLRFHVEQPEGGALRRYKTGGGPHTGLHLIMVREDLSRIIHRHPPVRADGTLSQPVTFPDAGPWHVVADVYPDLGENTLQNFQLTGGLDVGGAYRPRPLQAFREIQTAGGERFTMRRPGPLRALKPQFLDVTVQDAAGRPAKFERYYGALAHAIFFRKGSLAYFHTHVCGTGARACASSVGGTSVTGRSTTPGKLRVGMLLPTAGTWRLFLQVKIGGRAVTVPYTLDVS